MERKINLYCIVAASLCLIFMTASASYGAAFALLEWSARGESLGAGMIARADDPSTVAYNPAGITQLEGYNLQATTTMITVQSTVKTRNMYDGEWESTANEREYHFLPTSYLTAQLSDKFFLGAGVFTRFGLGIDWKDGWAGRYSTANAEMRSVSGNANLAYKANDKLSLAAGIEVITADVTLENNLDATRIFHATNQTAVLEAMGLPTTVNDPNTDLLDVKHKLKGDAVELGYNMALHYKFSDQVAMGISYRSRVTFNAEGEATFEKSPTVAALPLPGHLYAPTNFKADVTVPDMLFIGIMYKPKENFSLEFTTLWTNFSVYDKLEFKYDSPSVGVDTVSMEKNYQNTWRLGISAEWAVKPWMDLRASYVFDESPIDKNHTDYMVLDNDRNMFTVGAGFKKNKFQFDVGYMYLLFDDLDTNSRQLEDGFLQTNYRDAEAHIVGLSFSYAF